MSSSSSRGFPTAASSEANPFISVMYSSAVRFLFLVSLRADRRCCTFGLDAVENIVLMVAQTAVVDSIPRTCERISGEREFKRYLRTC